MQKTDCLTLRINLSNHQTVGFDFFNLSQIKLSILSQFSIKYSCLKWFIMPLRII